MDPFMVAYMVANRAKAFWGYLVTVLASVLGGVVLYILSAYFINQILDLLPHDMTRGFHHLVATADRGAFLFSFLGSFSPIPYTFVALTAGALKINLFLFFIGSLFGRAIRFGVVAYFVHFFGPRAVEIAKRNIILVSAIVFVAVVIIFILRRHF
jgi:undecaprenyl-diphosphatase